MRHRDASYFSMSSLCIMNMCPVRYVGIHAFLKILSLCLNGHNIFKVIYSIPCNLKEHIVFVFLKSSFTHVPLTSVIVGHPSVLLVSDLLQESGGAVSPDD